MKLFYWMSVLTLNTASFIYLPILSFICIFQQRKERPHFCIILAFLTQFKKKISLHFKLKFNSDIKLNNLVWKLLQSKISRRCSTYLFNYVFWTKIFFWIPKMLSLRSWFALHYLNRVQSALIWKMLWENHSTWFDDALIMNRKMIDIWKVIIPTRAAITLWSV